MKQQFLTLGIEALANFQPEYNVNNTNDSTHHVKQSAFYGAQFASEKLFAQPAGSIIDFTSSLRNLKHGVDYEVYTEQKTVFHPTDKKLLKNSPVLKNYFYSTETVNQLPERIANFRQQYQVENALVTYKKLKLT